MNTATFYPPTANTFISIPVTSPFRQIPGIHIVTEQFDKCDEIHIVAPHVDQFLRDADFPTYLRRERVFDYVLNQPDVTEMDKSPRWKKILVGRVMATWGYRAPSNSSREYVRRLVHG